MGTITVVDVRDDEERQVDPYTRLPESGVQYLMAPLQFRPDGPRRLSGMAADVVQSYGYPGARMRQLYRLFAQQRESIMEAVRCIESLEGIVVIHCVNGKDRTGVLSALVQLRSGLPLEYVLGDYLLTNDANQEINKADLAAFSQDHTEQECAVLEAMFEARPVYLKTFLEEFGGWQF